MTDTHSARQEYRMDCDCSRDLAHSLLEVGMTPTRFQVSEERIGGESADDQARVGVAERTPN
jgi:hypothetical protein